MIVSGKLGGETMKNRWWMMEEAFVKNQFIPVEEQVWIEKFLDTCHLTTDGSTCVLKY